MQVVGDGGSSAMKNVARPLYRKLRANQAALGLMEDEPAETGGDA